MSRNPKLELCGIQPHERWEVCPCVRRQEIQITAMFWGDRSPLPLASVTAGSRPWLVKCQCQVCVEREQ
jgi:hypothetical protein